MANSSHGPRCQIVELRLSENWDLVKKETSGSNQANKNRLFRKKNFVLSSIFEALFHQMKWI